LALEEEVTAASLKPFYSRNYLNRSASQPKDLGGSDPTHTWPRFQTDGHLRRLLARRSVERVGGGKQDSNIQVIKFSPAFPAHFLLIKAQNQPKPKSLQKYLGLYPPQK
jgi:hypothetical protein